MSEYLLSTFASKDDATEDEWTPKSFRVDEDNGTFSLDGEPFTPMSGEVRYSMMHPESWEKTLSLVKEAKMNCVTTAVEWALHEPVPGMYDFEKELDLKGFIKLAFRKRLKVILKIGPQSSPDRDLGGIPYWLLTVNPKMKFRIQDESFLFFLGRWLEKLYGVVQPCLIGNGGPIIMIQIEDAYGSYPIHDRNYLYWLRDVNRTYVGDRALLFTSDFNEKQFIERGCIQGVYATVKFGASSEKRVADQFESLREIQPKGPLMNSQYWIGSPTYWGDQEFRTFDAEMLVNDIADFIAEGIGFNLHLFRGGTNLGLTAGVCGGKYCMTSYDCDAPISEAGDPRKKWVLIKNLITEMTDKAYALKSEEEQRETVENIVKDTHEPELKDKGQYGIARMVAAESFMSAIQVTWVGKTCESLFAKSMEEMCVREGLLAYTAKLKKDVCKNSTLKGSVRDRAYVIINMTEQLGMIEDNIEFKIPKALPEGTRITFLVDNLGRSAYEPGKTLTKGLFNMYLNNEYIDNWVITTYTVRGSKKIEKLQNHIRNKLRDKNKVGVAPKDHNSEPYDMKWWLGNKANSSRAPNLIPQSHEVTPPAFYYGTFVIDKDYGQDNKKNNEVVHEPDLESDINYCDLGERFQDTYMNLTGWTKGIAYFNEWCLGRYWCIGPQQTLYVPGNYVRPFPWKNRITILELHRAPKDPKVTFVPGHIYANFPERDPVQGVNVEDKDGVGRPQGANVEAKEGEGDTSKKRIQEGGKPQAEGDPEKGVEDLVQEGQKRKDREEGGSRASAAQVKQLLTRLVTGGSMAEEVPFVYEGKQQDDHAPKQQEDNAPKQQDDNAPKQQDVNGAKQQGDKETHLGKQDAPSQAEVNNETE